MKFRWEKKYLYWGVTAFCVIAGSILFFSMINQWSSVHKVINRLQDILNPIILSLVIAYILNPVLTFAEKKFLSHLGKKIYPKNERKAWIFARVTGTVLVVSLLLALIAVILIFVMPQLYLSIQRLAHKMQDYYNIVVSWLYGILNDNTGSDTFSSSVLLKGKDYITDWLSTGLLPKLQDILIDVSSGVLGFLLSVFDFFVGIVLSMYVLYRKEELVAKVKMLTYSITSKRITDSLISAVWHIHRTFGQFIVGKLINSVLMGLICALFMLSLRMPYTSLVSVIIGATDMIPFFGPYIGTIPSVILVFLEDPFKGIVLTAFLLVLHTFNGNIMEPKIIGSSTGMSGFWVLSSILFFGGVFGVLGMLCGVPIFAVIYSGIGTWSRHRLKAKNFPTETEDFKKQGTVSQNPE